MALKNYKKFISFYLSVFLSVFISLSHPLVVLATEACGLTVPETWKQHFPFDLIYPINSFDTNIDTTCPTFSFWGHEREMCSIPMISAVAKNAFLLKVVIDSIIHL